MTQTLTHQNSWSVFFIQVRLRNRSQKAINSLKDLEETAVVHPDFSVQGLVYYPAGLGFTAQLRNTLLL